MLNWPHRIQVHSELIAQMLCAGAKQVIDLAYTQNATLEICLHCQSMQCPQHGNSSVMLESQMRSSQHKQEADK